MARKPVKLPDYFTAEEAKALVAAAPSYPVKMAMGVMLRTGLRVSETLSLRPADLRLNQDPPIISLRPEETGNKRKKGREALHPCRPGVDPRQGEAQAALRHQLAVGQQEHDGGGAVAPAGAALPGRARARCGTGLRPPVPSGAAVKTGMREKGFQRRIRFPQTVDVYGIPLTNLRLY